MCYGSPMVHSDFGVMVLRLVLYKHVARLLLKSLSIARIV